MSEVRDLIARMRAQACAVYIAAPKECADDIAATLRKAADELERLSRARG